jgi:hypothetical protein
MVEAFKSLRSWILKLDIVSPKQVKVNLLYITLTTALVPLLANLPDSQVSRARRRVEENARKTPPYGGEKCSNV